MALPPKPGLMSELLTAQLPHSYRFEEDPPPVADKTIGDVLQHVVGIMVYTRRARRVVGGRDKHV